MIDLNRMVSACLSTMLILLVCSSCTNSTTSSLIHLSECATTYISSLDVGLEAGTYDFINYEDETLQFVERPWSPSQSKLIITDTAGKLLSSINLEIPDNSYLLSSQYDHHHKHIVSIVRTPSVSRVDANSVSITCHNTQGKLLWILPVDGYVSNIIITNDYYMFVSNSPESKYYKVDTNGVVISDSSIGLYYSTLLAPETHNNTPLAFGWISIDDYMSKDIPQNSVIFSIHSNDYKLEYSLDNVVIVGSVYEDELVHIICIKLNGQTPIEYQIVTYDLHNAENISVSSLPIQQQGEIVTTGYTLEDNIIYIWGQEELTDSAEVKQYIYSLDTVNKTNDFVELNLERGGSISGLFSTNKGYILTVDNINELGSAIIDFYQIQNN